MRLPPPVLALGAAVAQRALTPGSPPPTAVRSVAAALVGSGSAGLMVASALLFRRRSTTVDPFHPERTTALVTSGANALTRNPMYVGMAGLLVAHSLVRGRPVALLPVGAFVAVIDRWQIPAEEEALSAQFEKDYEAYRSRTPRWLGARSLDPRGVTT